MRINILKIFTITLMLVAFLAHAETYQHCNVKLDTLLHSNKYKTDIYTGKNAKKVILSPATKRFRTQYQIALDTHPKEVMASHYVVTAWGCGAPCYGLGWVDLKNGKTFLGPTYSYSSEILSDSTIIINDRPDSQEQIDRVEWLMPEAYRVNDDGKFKLIYQCKVDRKTSK